MYVHRRNFGPYGKTFVTDKIFQKFNHSEITLSNIFVHFLHIFHVCVHGGLHVYNAGVLLYEYNFVTGTIVYIVRIEFAYFYILLKNNLKLPKSHEFHSSPFLSLSVVLPLYVHGCAYLIPIHFWVI